MKSMQEKSKHKRWPRIGAIRPAANLAIHLASAALLAFALPVSAAENDEQIVDQLQKSYDSKTAAALTTFIGQPLQGKWVLTVRDLVKRDKGMLNAWSLELGY